MKEIIDNANKRKLEEEKMVAVEREISQSEKTIEQLEADLAKKEKELKEKQEELDKHQIFSTFLEEVVDSKQDEN